MTYETLAAIKVSDLTRPKVAGEPINMHVVTAVREPSPNFDEMRRVIEGKGTPAPNDTKQPAEARKVPAL